MAETVNGGSSNQPRKEMSMEVRLLLAFILMGVVMFVSQYFFKTPEPPPGAQKTAQTTTAPKAPETAAVTPPKPETQPAPAAEPTTPPTAQQSRPPLTIDTDLFHIAISSQGGTVRSWQLKKYRDNDGKFLELVNTSSTIEQPFALHFPSQKPTTDVNTAWYTETPDPDGLGVTYQFSDGHTTVRKTFRFQKGSYLAQITSEVAIDGKPVPNMVEWRGGFGDLTVANPSSNQTTLYYDLTQGKLKEQTARDAKNGPAT